MHTQITGAKITPHFICRQCGKQADNSMEMVKHIRAVHESSLPKAIEEAKCTVKTSGSSLTDQQRG